MKRALSLLLCAAMTISLAACGKQELPQPQPAPEEPEWGHAVTIELSDTGITVNGEEISHDETAAVHDAASIVYYEEGRDFTYGEGEQGDAHSAEEAAAHTVVTITEPGDYVLSGKLSAGQIAVDLGKEAQDDINAVVTLVLQGVDITCTVAPAVIFYNVYECGSDDAETASKDVDTTHAGANVHIVGDTENNINGSYVARIYKPDSVVLSADGTEVEDAKKLHKYDAAFYSRMSMNVDGDQGGILNINAENEGLDSELHLTINGGEINIRSGNDGINTNEDGVSVTTVNGGILDIVVTGETGEGDGIDSNGWLVINEGAVVIASACGNSMDAGIDSDMGIHIASGATVIASGHMLDRIESCGQNYAVFQFNAAQDGSRELMLKAGEESGMGFLPGNDYSVLFYSDPSLQPGDYTLWSGNTQLGHSGVQTGGMGGFGGGGRPGGMMPGGNMQMPEGFDPNNMQMPEGFDPGSMPQWNGGNMAPPEMGQRPEGGRDFEMPENFDPSNMPNMPADFAPGGMPQGGFDGKFGAMGGGKARATEAVFTISTMENYFSGVGELSK